MKNFGKYVRVKQICGDSKKNIPGILPISKSAWWAGVKSGKYPQPIKLGPRTTCWLLDDVEKI